MWTKNGEEYKQSIYFIFSCSAFTLIELLIVISIISIIGIASISGFSHMSDIQDTETIIAVIDNTLDSFDRAVAKNDIISYEVTFKSGSLGFVTNIDTHKKSYPVQYSFDFQTNTGIIINTNTSTGIWEINFSTHDTVGQGLILPANSGTEYFSFPQDVPSRWYKIESHIDGSIFNSYIIQYYNLTNIKNISENEVQLVSILGGNNISYASLKIRNILGKKILEGSGSTIDMLSQATLLFEKNGKEMQMTIVP